MLTPELRDAIIAWLDAAVAGDRAVAARSVRLHARSRRGSTAGYREARAAVSRTTGCSASAEELHQLRQRVVDHRYQMELVEPLWPRHGRMWTEEAERLRDRLGRCQDLEMLKRLTGPHQPLAHWRSRLTPACAERTTSSRTAPPASPRACSPSGPRRSATGWKRCGSTEGSGATATGAVTKGLRRLERNQLGRGDYRGSGKSLYQCIMGQVSERCGGSSTGA